MGIYFVVRASFSIFDQFYASFREAQLRQAGKPVPNHSVIGILRRSDTFFPDNAPIAYH